MQELKFKHFRSEYLHRQESPVDRASVLFNAGTAETVISTDYPKDTSLFSFLVTTLLLPVVAYNHFNNRRKHNPHIEFLKFASDGRNKLIVFNEWLVRCTYQQYDWQQSKELFYFTGMPIRHVTRFTVGRTEMSISGFHSEEDKLDHEERGYYSDTAEMGGTMDIGANERERVVITFNNLVQSGRTNKTAKLEL